MRGRVRRLVEAQLAAARQPHGRPDAPLLGLDLGGAGAARSQLANRTRARRRTSGRAPRRAARGRRGAATKFSGPDGPRSPPVAAPRISHPPPASTPLRPTTSVQELPVGVRVAAVEEEVRAHDHRDTSGSAGGGLTGRSIRRRRAQAGRRRCRSMSCLHPAEQRHGAGGVGRDPAVVDLLHRGGVQVVPAHPALAAGDDQAGPLEHAEVLHHGAAVQLGRRSGRTAPRSCAAPP